MKKTLTAPFVSTSSRPRLGKLNISTPATRDFRFASVRRPQGLVDAVSHEGRQELRRHALGIVPVLSLAEAREAWREARKSIMGGIDPAGATKPVAAPVAVPARADTFDSVCEEWLRRDQEQKKSTTRFDARFAAILSPHGGRVRSRALASATHELIDAIVDKGSPSWRAGCTPTRTAYLFGRLAGDIVVKPLANLDMPSPATSRDRVLTDVSLSRYGTPPTSCRGHSHPETSSTSVSTRSRLVAGLGISKLARGLTWTNWICPAPPQAAIAC